jgi:hypothetical protein
MDVHAGTSRKEAPMLGNLNFRRSRLPLCALVALVVGLVCSASTAPAMATSTAVPPGLLLWNKLGSGDEVTHSAYGPNLVLFNCTDFDCGLDVPGTLGYPPGVFGGAASITGGPYFSGARIHTALLREPILDPEHGAVEVWYRQESDPAPFVHNPHRIFGGPYSLTGTDEVNLYSQDRFDSGDPRLHFTVFFGEEPPPFTEAHVVAVRSLVDGGQGYPTSALNGSWIHVAGVWDRSGIAGSADTVRLYVDGEVVAASQESDWGTTTCDHRLPGVDRCFPDVVGCNDTCADRFAADNLKVWGYAKTDYSDRFQEGFGQGQVYYLHGSGANPPTLSLDNTAPSATSAKFKDSTSISFVGGNPWKEIGNWAASPAGSAQTLSGLSDLHAFLGLKNSDDQGTQFDFRAEVFKNGVLVGTSTTRCITGVTRNPNLAKEVTAAFDPFAAVPVAVGDVVSLTQSTRIGTNPDGSKCSGPGGSHSSALGLRVYFDAVSRTARFTAALAP